MLAGKLGWGYEALLKQVQAPALRGKVHLAGYVDQKDLPAVYAGARLFVYPSLHEGFGFPPLEAMACGVPVISTLSSSLVENLEGAAELVRTGRHRGAGRCDTTSADRRCASGHTAGAGIETRKSLSMGSDREGDVEKLSSGHGRSNAGEATDEHGD